MKSILLHADSACDNWRPTSSLDNLRARANIISTIRNFFAERQVLEVDTPVLSHGTVTDPYVVGIPATYQEIGSIHTKECYLQTSPEYAMKRLLAAGSGAIYQICKAFRQGELGPRHNPEFTMLEWYRPGFDHHALMDEMDDLLQLTLKVLPAKRVSYANMFLQFLKINPHIATADELATIAKSHEITLQIIPADRNTWLDVLWTHCIEPHVGHEVPLFLYDFPASLAALAKVRDTDPPLASRFEVYFKGIELANGFHELQDAAEQIRRFQTDLYNRKRRGLPEKPIDKRFLAALHSGLPDVAGVALGLDRLIMLAINAKSISDVMTFSFDSA